MTLSTKVCGLLLAGALGSVLAVARYNRAAAFALVEWRLAREFADARWLAPGELERWLAAGRRRPPLLVDARSAAEYAVSHLKGARRLDPERPDLAALGDVAKDAPIVTYCSIGYRSAKVSRTLRRAGFTQVFDLKGSLFGWANAGRPLESEAGPTRLVHPYDEEWGRLLRPELRAPLPATPAGR